MVVLWAKENREESGVWDFETRHPMVRSRFEAMQQAWGVLAKRSCPAVHSTEVYLIAWYSHPVVCKGISLAETEQPGPERAARLRQTSMAKSETNTPASHCS